MFTAGCQTTGNVRDISDREAYRKIINTKFVLLKDCYLTKVDKDKNACLGIIPCGANNTPSELNEANIGKVFDGFEIVEVVPSGTVFYLKKVELFEIHSHVNAGIIIPIIELLSWQDISADSLLNENGEIPFFDVSLVKSVSCKKSNKTENSP